MQKENKTKNKPSKKQEENLIIKGDLDSVLKVAFKKPDKKKPR